MASWAAAFALGVGDAYVVAGRLFGALVRRFTVTAPN